MSSNLMTKLPVLYTGVEEMEEIMEVEDTDIDTLSDNLDDMYDDQFAKVATEEGIKNFETMFSILANTDIEDLPFRRNRLLNRFSLKPPFSLPFLEAKLDEIMGAGNWILNMNYNTYTLTIESSANNQSWNEEILITMTKLKPANIIFINTPVLFDNIVISEGVKYSTTTFNYRIGTSWVIGAKPFTEQSAEEVIKLATDGSIQSAMIEDIAIYTASDIHDILINNAYVVATITSTSTAGVITVTYTVPASSGVTLITNIKLRDVGHVVLSSANVYVPLLSDIVIKHTLTVKEGE